MAVDRLFAGIDFGTSGARICLIDDVCNSVFTHRIRYFQPPRQPARQSDQQSFELPQPQQNRHPQTTAMWRDTLLQLLDAIPVNLRLQIKRISLDGTSGTVLVADQHTAQPLTEPLMYDDNRATAEAEKISGLAPEHNGAQSAGSGLAKYLWLKQHYALMNRPCKVLTQTDYLLNQLTDMGTVSDINNCLKLGYDVLQKAWPQWMANLGVSRQELPDVVQPGQGIGYIRPALAKALGLPVDSEIVAGTTDSIAACMASGISQPGEALTSLGSTMVVKMVSQHVLFSAQHGVYSHPYGDYWLVGGASNCGGKVLGKYFDDATLTRLTRQIHYQPGQNQTSGLDYYPLCATGERFPLNDPQMQPRLEPRPKDDALFLQGLLESLSQVEYQAYQTLQQLGVAAVTAIKTVGGGSVNPVWTAMRQDLLAVPVTIASHSEAAYGAALLARKGLLR